MKQEQAVMTPKGVFCGGCVPASMRGGQDVFTIYQDMQMDTYPICQQCGRKHDYMMLTPRGERFEAEVLGPAPGDVLLTECGPADKLLEFYVVEDRVVGVYRPDQLNLLSSHVRAYQRDHPNATVWIARHNGVIEVAPTSLIRGDPLEQRVYVNAA